MGSINIGTFTLVDYCKDNDDHQKLASIFEKDNDFIGYVGDFWILSEQVMYDQGKGLYSGIYFAHIGREPVGMIGTIWPNDLPELIIGILPKYRGHHYSRMLYEEYSEYIFKNYQEYNSIYARIYPTNIHSIENAKLAGFEQWDKLIYFKKRG